MSVTACNNPNFFAMNDLSAQLMEQFCSCPDAKAIAALFAKNQLILVEVGAASFASTHNHYQEDFFGNLYGTNSLIQIPEQQSNASRIVDLAFEIFNTHGSKQFGTDLALAKKGELSMDQYARKLELQEISSVKGFPPLLQACLAKWGMDPQLIDYRQKQLSLKDEDLLNTQEIECHTDWYRKQWMERYKEAYCAKHPDDIRSCQTLPEQLCDYGQFQQMPPEENMPILINRLCTYFPKFSEEAKKIYEASVLKFCPDKLNQSDLSNQEL
jgi:hypothetical protein